MRVALALAGCLLCAVAAGAGPARSTAPCPWVGSTADPAARAAQVLARLDLEPDLKLQREYGLLTSVNADGYQNVTAPIPELCVPSFHFNDGPAGIIAGAAGTKTQLPAPIALAASFDAGAARSFGAVLGAEARAKGIDLVQSPVLDIARVPRGGRDGEGLGEDPYLTGVLGTAEVAGIQSAGADAIVKHFAAYNQETSRLTPADDVIVSERALREIYLAPFEAVVRGAHPAGVMCAYPLLNGTYACQSPWLLRHVLRGDWAFDGFIRSDLGAVTDVARAFAAGDDLIKPLDQAAFTAAVQSGAVPQARIDDAARRMLVAMFRSGAFDRAAAGGPDTNARTPGHRATARAVAEESAVLLRNGGLLPLDRHTVGSIAVVGDGQSAFTCGSPVVTGTPVTPSQGIAAAAGSSATVTFASGKNVAQAVAAAAAAKVAVVVVRQKAGECGDVASLTLQQSQDALVSAVAQANPNTVVVVNSVNPVLMPWLPQVAAVLETWYPGEEDGNALAALLFGDVDPSGKLPLTFPAAETATPVATAQQFPGANGRVEYSEGLDVGYRGYQARGIAPLFPFGFGLSYTTFRFARLRVSPAAGGSVAVEARVANTGQRPGTDVVQVYVGDPAAAGEPPRQLAAFARVWLEPGAAKVVRLRVAARRLAYWAGKKGWVVAAGRYRIAVGDSSTHLPLAATISRPAAAR